MSFQPVGYVYDADTHCVGHAVQRFGQDRLADFAEPPTDFEGNEVTAVYSWEMSNHHQDEDGDIVCSECVWDEVSSRPLESAALV